MNTNLGTLFLHWNNVISEDICQKIIEIGNNNWKSADTFGGFNEIRKSDVAYVDEQWITDLIWPYMLAANENVWKYDIRSIESLQITKYEKSGFYGWHRDGTGSHDEIFTDPSNEFLYGNTRKLSMSLILNSDFEGGDFEVFPKANISVPKLPQGSVIFFPAWLVHRVKPIKKGIRYSLVSWFLGPPFI